MPSKQIDNILQLRVSLKDIEPRILRCIQVPDSLTLKQLHRVIQIAMGWHDSHLHEFRIGGERYGEPDPEDEEKFIDEGTVRLRNLPFSIGGSFTYAYDFGDDWQHRVLLEEIQKPGSEAVYPACSAGERNAPPEDVGGPYGYAVFLAAIAEPNHEEHESSLRWVGGHFDPEAFSFPETNKRLRREFRPAAK